MMRPFAESCSISALVYIKGIWLFWYRDQLQIIFLGFLIFFLHHFSGNFFFIWLESSALGGFPFVTELSTSVFHSVEDMSWHTGVSLHNHHALYIFSWRKMIRIKIIIHMETCNWFLWEMDQTVMSYSPFYEDLSAY